MWPRRGAGQAARPDGKGNVSATTPPIEPLLEVASILRQAGVEFALGGSGLLHALGLADDVGDWDLTTDADLGMICRIFASLPYELHGPAGVHTDTKLQFFSGMVELIVGMAFQTPVGICHLPTFPAGEWRGVPLASPETWAAAYSLLGREAKAGLLFDHLRAHGAEPAVVARLLREPLPAALAGRLSGLPLGGGA
jgi:hypothetical protein